MEIHQLQFEGHAMGIPLNSLRVLRDSLAHGYNHSLAVLQIPTGENRCGFLVLDADDQSATFTGDGFSKDQTSGQASSAFLTAHVLFIIFSINLIASDPVNLEPVMDHYEESEFGIALNHARQILLPIASSVPDSEFAKPFEKAPGFLTVIPTPKSRLLTVYGSRH